MIRQHLIEARAPADPMFRWRGGDVSRVEALSDAVFAFALTLLVVSLEVPRTFDDLMVTIRRFPAFAVCFALLLNAWYYHYKFFRRYGLEDFATIVLNGIFLFLVLFYVYPLKFVFSTLIDPFFGLPARVLLDDGTSVPVVSGLGQARALMMFFSAGFAAISIVLIVMHLRAWTLRGQLELDDLEIELTQGSIAAQLVTLTIALASLVCASIGGVAFYASGPVWFLMGPAHFLNGWVMGSRAERVRARLDAPT